MSNKTNDGKDAAADDTDVALGLVIVDIGNPIASPTALMAASGRMDLTADSSGS
jgi:hypothetical protein